MTIWKRLSGRQLLIAVNTFSLAINLVALVLGAFAQRWDRVSITSVVLLVLTGGTMLIRMVADVTTHQLAKAKAERAFAEAMLEKLQSASGVTFGAGETPFKSH